MFASINSPGPKIQLTESPKPTDGALMDSALSSSVPANAVPAELSDPAPTLANSPPRSPSLVHSASSTSPVDSPCPSPPAVLSAKQNSSFNHIRGIHAPTASGKKCKKLICHTVDMGSDSFFECATCSPPAPIPTDSAAGNQLDDPRSTQPMPLNPADSSQLCSDTASIGETPPSSSTIPPASAMALAGSGEQNAHANKTGKGGRKSRGGKTSRNANNLVPRAHMEALTLTQAQEFSCEFPSFLRNGESIWIEKDEQHCVRVPFLMLEEIFASALKKLEGFEAGRFDWRFSDISKVDDWNAVPTNFRDLGEAIKKFFEDHPGENLLDSEEWLSDTCTPAVAEKLLNYSYTMAISDASCLNRHYTRQSSEVYGEILPHQLSKIADHLKLTENDVFVDLGSGVGNVAAYMSTRNIKLSAGIERCDLPADRSFILEKMLDRLLTYFRKGRGELKLHHGDFLAPEFRSLITEKATIILINNEVFKPPLMSDITQKLLFHLKNGTRVISVKEITTQRTDGTTPDLFEDFGSTSTVTRFKGIKDGLSWTSKAATFFIATVDVVKFMKHFDEISNQHQRRGGKRKCRNESGPSTKKGKYRSLV